MQNNYLGKDKPWAGILAATDFEVRITYHTIFKSIPDQLLFKGGMILNNQFITDWEAIRQHKQKGIDKNNQLEIKIVNCTHIEYGKKY